MKNKNSLYLIYKLTEKEVIQLTNAMHNPTLLDMQGQPLIPAQERCNAVWETIAESRNCITETICPVPNNGADYFQAIPNERKN